MAYNYRNVFCCVTCGASYKQRSFSYIKSNMKKISFFTFMLVAILHSCKTTDGEIYQSERDNVISAKNLIKEIDLGDVALSTMADMVDVGKYILFHDYNSMDKLMHLFEKTTYKRVASFGNVGQGPFEISNMGGVTWNKNSQELLVSDMGSFQMYSYNVDSVVANPDYKPSVKMKMDPSSFPVAHFCINDTMSVCQVMTPINNSGFDMCTGLMNLETGEINKKPYDREDIHKRRFEIAVSTKHNLYAECNLLYDLISVFDLDGTLKYNIYGPQWGETGLSTGEKCLFADDYLIVAYDGTVYEEYKYANKCFVFSVTGQYIATLQIGYNITAMCYDESNSELIFAFDDEIQFGSLKLNDVLK